MFCVSTWERKEGTDTFGTEEVLAHSIAKANVVQGEKNKDKEKNQKGEKEIE